VIEHAIEVKVRTAFVPQRSDPDADRYFFAYRIRITNAGKEPAKLLRRHWIITDGTGHVEEVEGPGVVGETPLLMPGETFEYTSACPLPTPVGTMHGSFQFLAASGQLFDAPIAPFTLAQPNMIH
jgi:ApaG protein